jgi:hypothetical protein
MAAASCTGPAVTLAISGDLRVADLDLREGVPHGVGGGLHQAGMEGRGDGEEEGALGAPRLGDLHRALHGLPGAGDDHLRGVVVVGGLADAAPGLGLLGDPGGRVEVEAEEGGHGALPHRDGGLHRLAAEAQEAGGVGDREGTRGAEGGVFAQGVARDIGGGRERDALGLERAQGGERGRHQRGLGVAGELEGVGVASQIRAESASPSASSTSAKTAAAEG